MMKKLWLVLLLWLVGCAGPVAETPTVESGTLVAAADTPTAAPTFTLLPSPTRSSFLPDPTIPLHNQITPSPIPTPTPDLRCPSPGSPRPFLKPETTLDLQESILAYANAGGQWNELPVFQDHFPTYDVTIVDLNGDNVAEVVMTFTSAEIESGIWVFQCQSTRYELIFNSTNSQFEFFDGHIMTDLTVDGRNDVLIHGGSTFSQGCDLIIGVLTWNYTDVQVYYLSTNVRDLPWSMVYCGADISIENSNGNSPPEIVILGTTMYGADYSPPREIRMRYEWRNGDFRLQEATLLPSHYRIHVFYDAQNALDLSNFDLAAQLYDQAAHDPALIADGAFATIGRVEYVNATYEHEHQDAYQRAFALFRLAAIQFFLQNEDEVSLLLDELDDTFPNGTPGYEFVIIADVLIDTLANGVEPTEACQSVAALIVTDYTNLAYQLGYWGYGPVEYSSENLCPFITN